MPAYPGYVHLCRLLGRDDMMQALGQSSESVPDDLDDDSRRRLRGLVNARIEPIALALVDEAGASDDVSDRAGALQFIHARIAEFGDLLTDDQARLLTQAVEQLTAGWS